MKKLTKSSALLVLAVLLGGLALEPAPALAQADRPALEVPAINWSQTSSALDDTFVIKKNFWRASAEVVGVNLLVWSYDRYIRPGGGVGFRIGFNSWAENLKNGFEWDDNNFNTNQFAHPYHGNLYFNAARSNGYNFWESIPFAFAGSWGWEYLGETHHPSMNDWIATSVGGSAMGEMLHRFSMMVRDNTTRGGERNRREATAMLINPMGGLNRLIDGEWSKVGPNDPERFANYYRSQMDVGFRTVSEEHIGDADTTRVFVEFDFRYGDPFQGDMNGPYDSFNLALQLNFGGEAAVFGLVRSVGLLGGHQFNESEKGSQIIGAFHNFDLVNNNQMTIGAQSIGAGWLTRRAGVLGCEFRTGVHLNGIILGASESDYPSISGRDYDYGPGFSTRLWAFLGKNGFHYFNFNQDLAWIHAVNGNKAEHYLSATRVRLGVPIRYSVGLGFEYTLLLGERKYELYEDVSTRFPQTRLYLTWAL
jgi:hypothetical protein